MISGSAQTLDLMDLLPTELIESGLFPYLTRKELKRIRLNRRLKEISDSVMDKRDRKCKYIFLWIRIKIVLGIKCRANVIYFDESFFASFQVPES